MKTYFASYKKDFFLNMFKGCAKNDTLNKHISNDIVEKQYFYEI